MKRTAIALAVAALLSGCASLTVSWDFQASYNRQVTPVNLDLRVSPEKKAGSGT